MFNGIIENAGTIVVSALLTGLVILIIVRLHKDKKQGKASCGGSCGGCSMADSCHNTDSVRPQPSKRRCVWSKPQ